jgi:hypothetical protein
MSYTVLHPILLQESGSLHGKATVAVGRAVHPHGCVTADVVVHWGIMQDRQAVAVLVSVGQLTVLHGLVTVEVRLTVSVVVLTLVVTLVLITVDVTVVSLMEVSVTVSVSVVVSVIVLVGRPGRPVRTVDGVSVTP